MFTVPNVPRSFALNGDSLYVAVSQDGVDHLARDWRASERNNQVQPTDRWIGTYMERRRTQTIQNIPSIEWTIRDLKGIRSDRAAYIVLSGPSLPRNLYEHPPRDGDVVIGVNRGAAEFMRAFPGRHIDYLLVADGVVSPDYAYKHWGVRVRATDVVAIVCASPEVADFLGVGGRKPYWFRQAGWGHDATTMGWPMDLPDLEYSFNSGTLALHLADLMGCNPIVFVGCDQALTGGEFHPGEKASEGAHQVLCVPDMHGNWTMARLDQFIAAKKIETWAFILKQYGVKVVNLTGAGIVHRFVEQDRL